MPYEVSPAYLYAGGEYSTSTASSSSGEGFATVTSFYTQPEDLPSLSLTTQHVQQKKRKCSPEYRVSKSIRRMEVPSEIQDTIPYPTHPTSPVCMPLTSRARTFRLANGFTRDWHRLVDKVLLVMPLPTDFINFPSRFRLHFVVAHFPHQRRPMDRLVVANFVAEEDRYRGQGLLSQSIPVCTLPQKVRSTP